MNLFHCNCVCTCCADMSLFDKPFYQRWWFLVIVALIGIIIILIVVGILYVTGKKRRRNAKSLSWLLTCFFAVKLLVNAGSHIIIMIVIIKINNHHNNYSALIIAEPLREFARFMRWIQKWRQEIGAGILQKHRPYTSYVISDQTLSAMIQIILCFFS